MKYKNIFSYIILSVFLSLAILYFTHPSPTYAQPLLFQDNFDDCDALGWIEYNPQGYWKVENGEYIGNAVNFGGNEKQSTSITGNVNWENYIYEIRVKGIEGVDKLISFRVNNTGKRYTLNMRSGFFGGGNDITLEKRSITPTTLKTVRFFNKRNIYYKFKVEVVNINSSVGIKLYIDDNPSPTLEYTDEYDPILKGTIGLEVWPGAYQIPSVGLNTTTIYDDVKVYSLDDKFLNVPDIKQFTNPWGPLEYDSATDWYPSNPSISRWGCALTSSSMVLKYYKHDINPNALNEWLNAQDDGYTRNGGIIWPTLSRLTFLRNSYDNSLPILEFAYLNFAEDTLKNEIQNNRPGILKLVKPIYDANGNIINYSTHFIVGKGYNDTGIFINDPGKDGHTTLSQANLYWGSTSKIGQFKKSETDLSYIVLYINDGFDIEISDENGETFENINNFQEEPFTDPVNPESESNVETLNAFYFPKPETGNYTIEINGDGLYRLDYYIYDQEGNVQTGNSLGILSGNQTDYYTIEFDKNDEDMTQVPKISLLTVLSFWEDMYKNKYFENQGLYLSVKQLLENSYKNFGKSFSPHVLLENILKMLDNHGKQYIDGDAFYYFKYQIEYLLAQYD